MMTINRIHSQTTRIPGLRESFDLRIEMKEQLALIRDFILKYDRWGLTYKQIVLGDVRFPEIFLLNDVLSNVL